LCLQRVAELVLFMLLKFLSSTSGSRNFWFLSNFLNSSSNSTEIADFSSDDELSKKINCCLLFHVYYMRVAKLLLSIVELESKSLSCDMYEALNNVRIMSRASHKNTDKRRVNQINENSKLKSEIYQDTKTICTEEREALNLIKSRLTSRICISVED